MELPVAELRNAQSRLDIAMNRIEEIIAEVHKMRLNEENLSDVRSKLEFLQDDLIKRQKLVSAIVKQIKKMKKFRGQQGKKQMSKTYEKLQAYETEVSVLSKIQNEVATISNKDFAELRRMMNPSAALRDLFTGIAILFKVPKWKRWPNVQSFIAKASTKTKILELRPHHLDARTVKRVRKFLNEHEDTVNRLAAYKANRKIAPLEPWLRTMVALAEKIVIYGLAPETLELELQKMQQEIKSENELTQTVAKCKAKEKEIINAFRAIFRAKGENFEGFRTLSDFLGVEAEEDDSDLDIGEENEEAKDGTFPVSDFVKKDKGSQPLSLGFSIGVNSSDVLGESSESRRPRRAAKGSRRHGRPLEESNDSSLKKKKVRSSRVLSYFSGPSNSIPGKGRREQAVQDENSRRRLGKKNRRKEKNDELPDLGDLLEENTKARGNTKGRGKSSKGRKLAANKDIKESRTFRSRNGAQSNESSRRKGENDLLESKGKNFSPELTLDDNPRPTSLSISASRGSTFKPTIDNFTDIKYEEEDDRSLSLDESLSLQEPLTVCVTSNVHVSAGDYGVYKDFEEESKAHSDNQDQGVETNPRSNQSTSSTRKGARGKNPRSNQSNKAQVGDDASSTRKGAKERSPRSNQANKAQVGDDASSTRKGAKERNPRSNQSNKAQIGDDASSTRKGAKERTPRSNQSNKAQIGDHASSARKGAKDNRKRKGVKDNRTGKGVKDNRARKGAKDKAISSHDGSQNLSMSSVTTSGTVIPSLHNHSTDMGKVISEQKSDNAYQKSSTSMSVGINDQPSGNLNGTSRAAGNNNSSSDVGKSAYALTSISNQTISIDSASSLPEGRSASEIGGSGVNLSRDTSSHTRRSLVEFPERSSLVEFADDGKIGKLPICNSVRESVVVADMPIIDQKVVEEDDEELDPEVLQTLVVKMRKSLRDLNVDGLDLHESEEKNTDQFKDIILRYNRHRRNSISVDTDAFDIWKGMGYEFKNYKNTRKKVGNVKKNKKEIGYHVEEETPYFKLAQEMRTKREISSGALEALDVQVRRRVNTS